MYNIDFIKSNKSIALDVKATSTGEPYLTILDNTPIPYEEVEGEYVFPPVPNDIAKKVFDVYNYLYEQVKYGIVTANIKLDDLLVKGLLNGFNDPKLYDWSVIRAAFCSCPAGGQPFQMYLDRLNIGDDEDVFVYAIVLGTDAVDPVPSN